MKILVAEDTRDLNRNITLLLRHEGYAVESVFDGLEALECLKSDSFDCVVLDIMMPGLDGLAVLKQMRERNIPTPVLLLTAKAEVEDRVAGLDAGADDYLPKPFAFKELLARIRALIRRLPSHPRGNLTVGDIKLDAETHSLSATNSVGLSNKEFELMVALISNHDIELSTEYLIEHVWKSEEGTYEETVWLYISYLKRKLAMINSSLTISGAKGGSFQLQS